MTRKEIEKKYPEIINSKYFKDCTRVSHHFNSTIADHSINVAIFALQLAEFFKIKVDKELLVKTALMHDLAMAHTKSLYGFSGYFTTAFRHPIDSARFANEIMELTKKQKQIITRHMFPLCILPPTSKEGWVITLADKYVAIQEIIHKEIWICS